MKTFNEIIRDLEEIKNTFDSVKCNEVVKFSLTIPYSNSKGREHAKKHGFKFNWDSKTWEKSTDYCESSLVSYITNVFKS